MIKTTLSSFSWVQPTSLTQQLNPQYAFSLQRRHHLGGNKQGFKQYNLYRYCSVTTIIDPHTTLSSKICTNCLCQV